MKVGDLPRITFGIIVLNGEPFTKYCLRSLYPYAHEIIVVEGGSKNAMSFAPDGHSTDGTLEALHEFKEQEDPEDKIKIITKDGFWEEKDEQSQAYAQVATGDYLWQVDIDEFYRFEDIREICATLAENPSVDGIGFEWKNFWGNFDTIVESWLVRRSEKRYGGHRRIFRWGKGFKYITHRPPTVIDDEGRSLGKGNWIKGKDLARKGIYCYHYGMVFQKQAIEKAFYYKRLRKKFANLDEWYKNVFLRIRRPFHILHGSHLPSWVKRFSGRHPEQIVLLQKDLKGRGDNLTQGNEGIINQLLSSRFYQFISLLLSIMLKARFRYRLIENLFNRAVNKLDTFFDKSYLYKSTLRKPLEEFPDAPDLFKNYRSWASFYNVERVPGGWMYEDNFYPDYLFVGGAAHAIFPTAKKYCKGQGIDIGAGILPFPGSIPIDIRHGPGLQNSLDSIKPKSLDYIFSSHCLEHIADYRAALKEWVSKLKRGGIIFLYLPHIDCRIWRPGSPFVGHVWSPTSEIVSELLEDAGVEIIDKNPDPDMMQSFYVVGRKI